MAKTKKKKLSDEERHRQLQDQVEYLPMHLDQLRGEGKWFRAGLVRWLAAPVIRTMKRLMDRQRYGGPQGAKLKQSEQMKRRLEMKRKQLEYIQGEMQRQQKKAQKRNKTR